MQSFATWQNQHWSDGTTAFYSISNGVLTAQDENGQKSVAFKDIDLNRITTSKCGAWHLVLPAKDGSGSTGLGSYINQEGDAFHAIQDVYDLAYLAQANTKKSTKCVSDCCFGSLDQYKSESIHDNENIWSDVETGASSAGALVLYRIADLVHGPTLRGGQGISFGIKPLGQTPMKVTFDVALKSNTGAQQTYRLGTTITNPAGEVNFGINGLLSREPFPPGQCIIGVSVSPPSVEALVVNPFSNRLQPASPGRAAPVNPFTGAPPAGSRGGAATNNPFRN